MSSSCADSEAHIFHYIFYTDHCMQAFRGAWQRAEPLRAQLCAAAAAAAAVRAQPAAVRGAAAIRSGPGAVWCPPVRGPCPTAAAAAAVTLRGPSGAPAAVCAAAVCSGAADSIVPADRRRWRVCRTGRTVPAAAAPLRCCTVRRRVCRCAHMCAHLLHRLWRC